MAVDITKKFGGEGRILTLTDTVAEVYCAGHRLIVARRQNPNADWEVTSLGKEFLISPEAAMMPKTAPTAQNIRLGT